MGGTVVLRLFLVLSAQEAPRRDVRDAAPFSRRGPLPPAYITDNPYDSPMASHLTPGLKFCLPRLTQQHTNRGLPPLALYLDLRRTALCRSGACRYAAPIA